MTKFLKRFRLGSTARAFTRDSAPAQTLQDVISFAQAGLIPGVLKDAPTALAVQGAFVGDTFPAAAGWVASSLGRAGRQ